MDLRQAVIQSIDRLIASEAIEKMIQETVSRTIKELVGQALGTYGPFAEALKVAITKSLDFKGDELNLPSYNDAILKIVRTQVAGHTDKALQRQVAENLAELLKPAPETLTLSALVDLYRDELRERLRDGCVCHGDEHRITIDVRQDNSFWHVELSAEPQRRRHDGDIQLGATREGRIYWLAFRNKDVERDLYAGPFYGFERALFQMKAAGTKLIVDCEPSDLETSYSPVEI